MVPAGGNALYYAEDSLGSSRVIVQSTGTLCYDADFTPFGSERSYTSTCAQNYKFEGKERDTETGNDDFGARYYTWRFGRWLSSDWSALPVPVPYANLANPQTLNLYSMVADDPESFADLDGHVFWAPGLGNDNGETVNISAMAETGVGEGVGFFSAPASNNESNQQASTAPTPPMDVPAPLVLPALGEAAKDLVVGAIETLALPFIVLDYLVSPNSGGNSGYRDTTDAPGGPKNSSTTGPKAADAPGVTAGGQATDKFGNKIAPSGETQVNKTKSTTREGARNKALNEGSRAAEHKRDQKMGPHFHPADASGEKKPSSTHHEYPE